MYFSLRYGMDRENPPLMWTWSDISHKLEVGVYCYVPNVRLQALNESCDGVLGRKNKECERDIVWMAKNKAG